jgi:hypothetical protein
MTIRCPACRAENTEATCRRCKADLSLLFSLEAERERVMETAKRALREGRPDDAYAAAWHAQEIRRGDDAVKLVALAHAARGDFAEALRWHQSLQAEPQP